MRNIEQNFIDEMKLQKGCGSYVYYKKLFQCAIREVRL